MSFFTLLFGFVAIFTSLVSAQPLGSFVALNHSRPAHLLDFIMSSRILGTKLESTKVALLALMPPNGAGQIDEFVNITAEAARRLEQHYRLGKVPVIITDPHGHHGFHVQEHVFESINRHLPFSLKSSDFSGESLRQDHHQYEQDQIEEHRELLESSSNDPNRVLPKPRRSIRDRLHIHDFPAYVIVASGDPQEVWDGRQVSGEELAARTAAVANANLRILNPRLLADFASRSPVSATVVVRRTCRTSEELRVALSPFAQFVAGDEAVFENTGRDIMLVVLRDVNRSEPLPNGVLYVKLNDVFGEDVGKEAMRKRITVLRVHLENAGAHLGSWFKKQQRKVSLSSASGDKEYNLSPESRLGMESLRVLSQIVVPPVLNLSLASLQSVYARGSCVVAVFHGRGIFDNLSAVAEMGQTCTFLYGDDQHHQSQLASFGFELDDSASEKQLLVGVHYDHRKYKISIEMAELPIKVIRMPSLEEKRRKKSRLERARIAQAAIREREMPAADDSPYALPDDIPTQEHSDGKVAQNERPIDVDDHEDDDEPPESPQPPPATEHHTPQRPQYDVRPAAQKVNKFIKDVLAGVVTPNEKVEMFEGEFSDPLSDEHGEHFFDFVDTDALHKDVLSDFSRDSFLVLFPPSCKNYCSDQLHLMSAASYHIKDGGFSEDAFRTFSITFYNTTRNTIHKYLDPKFNTGDNAHLIFLERIKKFHFFAHHRGRFQKVRYPSGVGDKDDSGIIDSESIELTSTTPLKSVYDFMRAHSHGARYATPSGTDDLRNVHYDEL